MAKTQHPRQVRAVRGATGRPGGVRERLSGARAVWGGVVSRAHRDASRLAIMAGPVTPGDEQLAYYRAIADEYEDHAIEVPGQDELLSAIESFRPTGHVLELACGPGVWTKEASPIGRERDGSRRRAGDAGARTSAVGSWCFGSPCSGGPLLVARPSRRYDTIFFGFWISHVPEDRFESFWSLVDEALERDGTVFFFDDNHRTDAELAEGPNSPIVQRRLNDGTAFRVVKIPYQPAELEHRMRALSWDITVRGTSGPFY